MLKCYKRSNGVIFRKKSDFTILFWSGMVIPVMNSLCANEIFSKEYGLKLKWVRNNKINKKNFT